MPNVCEKVNASCTVNHWWCTLVQQVTRFMILSSTPWQRKGYATSFWGSHRTCWTPFCQILTCILHTSAFFMSPEFSILKTYRHQETRIAVQQARFSYSSSLFTQSLRHVQTHRSSNPRPSHRAHCLADTVSNVQKIHCRMLVLRKSIYIWFKNSTFNQHSLAYK